MEIKKHLDEGVTNVQPLGTHAARKAEECGWVMGKQTWPSFPFWSFLVNKSYALYSSSKSQPYYLLKISAESEQNLCPLMLLDSFFSITTAYFFLLHASLGFQARKAFCDIRWSRWALFGWCVVSLTASRLIFFSLSGYCGLRWHFFSKWDCCLIPSVAFGRRIREPPFIFWRVVQDMRRLGLNLHN